MRVFDAYLVRMVRVQLDVEIGLRVLCRATRWLPRVLLLALRGQTPWRPSPLPAPTPGPAHSPAISLAPLLATGLQLSLHSYLSTPTVLPPLLAPLLVSLLS